MSCNQSHVLHDLAILHNHHNFSAKLTNHHNDAAFGHNDKVAQNSTSIQLSDGTVLYGPYSRYSAYSHGGDWTNQPAAADSYHLLRW